MGYFPFFIDISAKKCVVVGGGIVAKRKVEKLLPYEPEITVVAPEICEFLRLCEGITLVEREFEPSDLDGAFMVIGATDNEAVNAEIFRLCTEKNILVNVVDDKEKCGFIFPALVKKGDISIGVSSSGSSPVFSKYIKENDPTAKIVFIGPCTAKKMEIQLESVKPYVDSVMTFEELQEVFDSRDIELSELEGTMLDNASYYGRIFARCGGLADAVAQALKEQGNTEFELKGVSCDGVEECKRALLRASKNALPNNFIEGMACVGGCIGGAGCLTHGEKNKAEVDKYGMLAHEKTITEAVSAFTDISGKGK